MQQSFDDEQIITGDVLPVQPVRTRTVSIQPPRPLDLSVSARSGRDVIDGVMLPMGRRLQLRATGGYDKETQSFLTVLSLRLRF